MLVVYFIILINVAESFDSRKCKRNGKFQAACRSIYVWDSRQDDYVSLLNETFTKVEISDEINIKDRNLRVLAHNMKPYITSSNYSQELGGFIGQIWSIIQEVYGFKYTVRSIFFDTGVNMIDNGDADVMLAAAVTKETLINVDYSQPYFYNWYLLYLKSPKGQASSASYIKTFSKTLWLLACHLFALLTITLWLTTKILRYARVNERTISLPSSFLCVVSGFINQGFDLQCKSLSSRIQVLFALLFGVVLYSAMSAVLFAQLAVFDTHFPFASLEDIAASKTHSLCIRKSSFVYRYFSDDNEILLPKWRSIVNHDRNCLDMDVQENIPKMICNDNVIVFENKVIMSAVMKYMKIPCDVVSFKKRYFRVGNVILMWKSLREKKLLDKIMQKLRTSGILQRLEEVFARTKTVVEGNKEDFTEVTLERVIGVLYLYFLMIVASLVILVIEMLWHKYM